MSKNEQIETKDLFSTCQENADKIFTGIRQSVPAYHQSITNVQQEYLQTYENLVSYAITLQKESAKKSGMISSIPEPALQAMHKAAEEFVKVAAIHNKITLATIDTAQQNIKTFNDNAKTFSELNRNIIQSWFSIFVTKNN